MAISLGTTGTGTRCRLSHLAGNRFLKTSPSVECSAVVTGGSSGLGLVIAAALLRAGYRVALIGRDRERLTQAIEHLRVNPGVGATARRLLEGSPPHDTLFGVVADVTDPASVREGFDEIERRWSRMDVLINCVGQSDRGRVEALTPERLRALFDVNVTSALLCSQAALPMLRESRGTVVNIGSLAGKFGTRYMGGYCAAKHALAGLSQQMRLEWLELGVHVAVVHPGPIRRADTQPRYQVDGETLPESAKLPAGGAQLRGLLPERVADEVLRCIRGRRTEVILPRHVRLLSCLAEAFPALGDRLLLRFTGGRSRADS